MYVRYFLTTLVGTIRLPTFVGIRYCTNYCYVAGATCVLIRGTGVVFTPHMGRRRICMYPLGIVPTGYSRRRRTENECKRPLTAAQRRAGRFLSFMMTAHLDQADTN